jgi:uridine phosphorylase
MNWLVDVPEDDEEHFTARAFLNYTLGSRGLTMADLAVPPVVLATFQPHTYAHLLHAIGGEEHDLWRRLRRLPLAQGAFDGKPLALVLLPVGAPAAVMYLEELAIGGAQTVLSVGSAGSLQEHIPLGSAVLPARAVREEGTSYHYRPPEFEARPDAAAVAALRDACRARGIIPHEGLVWTTDAVFRELTSKVRRMAAAGVLAVDMEASALFIVGAVRGLRVASLFFISDELFHPWSPGFFDRRYREASLTLAECALTAAVGLAGDGEALTPFPAEAGTGEGEHT